MSASSPTRSNNAGNALLDGSTFEGLVHQQRFGDSLAHGAAWVEAGKGVLEDDLHLATMLVHLAGFELGDVDAIEHDAPAGRLEQSDHEVGQGRLAASALTHDGQGLAFSDGKIDTVHGFDLGDFTGKEPSPDGKVLDQSLHPQKLPAAGHGWPPRLRSTRSSRKQAAKWFSSTGLSCGVCRAHRSVAYRQRSLKWQPLGRSSRLGTIPGIALSMVRPGVFSSTLGIDSIRPSGVGVQRIVEDIPGDCGVFHHPPGVHDDDIVGHVGDHAQVVGDKEDGRLYTSARSTFSRGSEPGS